MYSWAEYSIKHFYKYCIIFYMRYFIDDINKTILLLNLPYFICHNIDVGIFSLIRR